MKKIGFLGLGHMGGPMAINIAKKSKVPLVVYDPSPKAMAAVTAAGAQAAQSPKDVADQAEIVIACLRPLDVNINVALGQDGVIHGSAIRIYVETSTMGQKTADTILSGFAGSRITLVDSPISGGVRGATAGTLSTMVAGPKAAVDEAEPYIRMFSKEMFRVGERPGLGQVCKLTNNAISNAAMVATAEALVVGTKAGLDPALLLEVINASTGRNSHSLVQFPKHVLPRTFDYGSYLDTGVKDLSLYCDLAHGLGVPIWMGTAVTEIRRAAVAHLGGQKDISTLIQLLEHLAGVEVKPGTPETSKK